MPFVTFDDNLYPKSKLKDAWKKPKEPSDMDKFKIYDILTLKKLVIEELKNELELVRHG